MNFLNNQKKSLTYYYANSSMSSTFDRLTVRMRTHACVTLDARLQLTQVPMTAKADVCIQSYLNKSDTHVFDNGTRV